MFVITLLRNNVISTAKVHKKNDIRKCYVIFFRNSDKIREFHTPRISAFVPGIHTGRVAEANDGL